MSDRIKRAYIVNGEIAYNQSDMCIDTPLPCPEGVNPRSRVEPPK